jgi:hypothetical protein
MQCVKLCVAFRRIILVAKKSLFPDVHLRVYNGFSRNLILGACVKMCREYSNHFIMFLFFLKIHILLICFYTVSTNLSFVMIVVRV